MNKPRLIILSDIFGRTEEEWMKEYEGRLSPYFKIIDYDSRELAGISALPQSEVHAGFVNGGINRAVQNLISTPVLPDVIVGFSVGGTIAWKYALKNANPSLYLISATRLRNETTKPLSPISLYYGELEEHGPSSKWFQEFKLSPEIFEKESHECYKSQNSIERVCQRIIEDFA